MTKLSRVRKALFVIMLVAVMGPASVQARFVDECPNQDCRECGVGPCWLPYMERCWDYFNCASVGDCTQGEGGFQLCYCGPCPD
jgi:hypothetical protein